MSWRTLGLAAVLAVAAAGGAVALPTGKVAPGSTMPRCDQPAAVETGEPVSSRQLGAVHFLSPTVGVALTASQIPCAQRVFAGGIEVGSERQPVALAVTRDGGRSWMAQGVALPQPPAGVLVQQLVATSTNDVWASTGAGAPVATTDGGVDWTPEPLPGPVVGLTLTKDTLWALACPRLTDTTCRPMLARKRLPNGTWRPVASPARSSGLYPTLATPSGRTIVVNTGPYEISRLLVSADGGRHWTRTDPSWMGRPCSAAGLATAGPQDWWLICLGSAAAGSSTKALLHTTDAGAKWTIASQVTSLTAPPRPGTITTAEPDALAAGSRARLWLASQNSLSESENGGLKWTSDPGPNPQGSPASFDVLSATHAWLLAAGQGLWRTTDGRHWRAL